MLAVDQIHWVVVSLRGAALRSFLTLLGIAIGIAAVVLLTAVGEGARRYVVGEFTQFGTRLMAVTPGRSSS